MARDARGAEISVGDTVVYVSGGRYVKRGVARVEKVSGSRVTLSDWEPVGGGWNTRKPEWAEGSSCFVVEALPQVDGRLNT